MMAWPLGAGRLTGIAPTTIHAEKPRDNRGSHRDDDQLYGELGKLAAAGLIEVRCHARKVRSLARVNR